jgi:oxygen-independent coproporphyrinogen-3 oxidase
MRFGLANEPGIVENSAMRRYAIYVHLPFCRARCPYCDFFSTTPDPIPFAAYREALVREWRWRSPLVAQGKLVSVYLGGGTPSLWPSHELVRLLYALPVREADEVTIELNPKDLPLAWASELLAAGISRFSVGVQALDDRRLSFLGRRHTVGDAVATLSMLKGLRAPSVSADVIYGTPGHKPRELAEELHGLVDAGVRHVSAYELTVAPDTAFGRDHRAGRFSLPVDAEQVALWRTAREVLARRGIHQYEVSNFACPGSECRQNAHYWAGGEYIGLGLGAHGFVRTRRGDMVRYANEGQLADYMGWAESRGTRRHAGLGRSGKTETISPLDRAREKVMLGLRTTRGVQFDNILSILTDETASKWREIGARLVTRQMAEIKEGRLVPTTEGLLHADALAEEFF